MLETWAQRRSYDIFCAIVLEWKNVRKLDLILLVWFVPQSVA